MFSYSFQKTVNSDVLVSQIIAQSYANKFSHIDSSIGSVDCHFTSELIQSEIDSLTSVVTNHVNTPVVAQATQVEITKQAEAQPFALPAYRTKRNATSNLIQVPLNSVETIDYVLPSERYVTGGTLIISGALLGDYISAEIVDVNGIIPSPYRSALCENYPIVATYIEKEWIEVVNTDNVIMKIDTYPLNARITAGLGLRITYHSINSGGDRLVAVNYNLSKKL